MMLSVLQAALSLRVQRPNIYESVAPVKRGMPESKASLHCEAR